MASLTVEECFGERSPGRLLRRINKLMIAHVGQRFTQADLSFPQWLALKLVDDAVVECPGDLARELDMTSGAATRLIDTLEKFGFLRRERSPSDRRVIRLRISTEGKKTLRRLAPALANSWNEILSDFADGEVEQLIELLFQLQSRLRRQAAPISSICLEMSL